MTMIDRGFIVKEALAPWAVLLEEWCLLYERYCRMLEGKDSPCFNKEIANVGFLAGAAWRCGWVCLMEWPKAKVGEVQGRNDLWMSSAAWSWCIEAKMGWMEPNETVEANRLLALACVDAQRIRGLRDYKNLVGVALCCLHSFVQHEDLLDQQLSQTIGALQPLEYDALAWCFPQSIRRLRHGNRLYPGLMLLARVVEVEAD